MQSILTESETLERAYLIGIQNPHEDANEAKTLLDELEELVHTLGIEIVAKECVHIRKPTSAYLIGSGKAKAIAESVKESKCNVIIFDNELTPAQQKNWEKLTKVPTIDRQEIILDIFAKRAQTKEAVLQVELAHLQYVLPRLTRAWTHLERQRGGSAKQRGVGEKQLEMDKRMIRKQITRVKKELKEVIQHREVQRKRRIKIPLPTASIIGYTNVGKSSLLNFLTGAKVLVENKLFATLDPTTRSLNLPNGQKLLITDTVGFVRRLPHGLVEAFKATLEETIASDFLIHVADLSSPDVEHHMQTTLKVMKELGAKDKSIITVFNKVDLEINPIHLSSLKAQYPNAFFISSKTGKGIDSLLAHLETQLETTVKVMHLKIPHDRYDLVNTLHEMGAVKKEKFENDGVYITANVPDRMIAVVEPFQPEFGIKKR